MDLEFTGERFIPGCGTEISYEHFTRYFFSQKLVEGKKVLDLPSGEGYGTHFLSKNALKVVGGDISEEAVRSAGSKYKSTNLEFRKLDMTNLDFGEKSFDVITCFEGIEHVNESQQEQSLSHFSRILGQEGILVISTPNRKVYDDVDHRNEFHKREYYFNEFKLQLESFFKNVVFFGQTTIDGLVFRSFDPKENSENASLQRINTSDILTKEEIETHTYFIAVCSQTKVKMPSQSVFYNLNKDLVAERVLIENQIAQAYFSKKIQGIVDAYEKRWVVRTSNRIMKILKKLKLI
jgi:ubiquinone/menaquinone biosynthesis C-methylase UbiE